LNAKLAAVGWKYTTALRRLSSSNTAAKPVAGILVVVVGG
jgi:hypothetical protein